MPDVLAEWMARLAGQRVLDIGCGRNKTPGALGMDANPYADADVIEHVQSPLAVIVELHRIVRPGGWVLLVAPHWTNPDFATDLTHRNHLNSYSFRNLTVGQEVFEFYAPVRFRQRPPYVTLLNLWRACGLEWLVNLDRCHPRWRFLRRFWEQYLNAVVRGKEVYFELEVIKPDQPTL
jgi:SAM-dependent methyltransferase